MSENKGAAAPAAKPEFHPSDGYKRYVLGILLIVSTFNYLDRQIINILIEPIKQDLGLADWQLGMITGLSFALFYSVLGIPIARLADRRNRPWVIAVSIAVWSAFTLVCGMAQNFTHLLLARIGVGCGEAGGTPPAHSLISDYTTPQNRASALAVFSLGSPIGALLGLSAGGLLAEALGWRAAFFVAAAPGLVVALLIVMTVKEPRKAVDGAGKPRTVISFPAAIRQLRGKRSFLWISAAAASAAMVISGHGAFYGSYFIRHYGAELGELTAAVGPLAFVGLILGVVKGVGGSLGTLAGGRATDMAVARDRRGYCIIPAICMLLAAPCFAFVMLAPGVVSASVLLFLPAFFGGAILGPTFAAVQTMVAPGTRATAAAVLLFLLNIVGTGLGPVLVGVLSDVFGARFGEAEGLKWAMLSLCPVLLLSAFCYWRAAVSVVADLDEADA